MPKLNRRNFIKHTSAALAATGVFTLLPSGAPAQNHNSMFVHHVYFWLKNASSKEDKARLLKGLQSLQKIETIKMSHIGVPAGTNRSVIDTSYQVSWLLIFDTPKDQEVYQNHPVHLKFVEDCAHLWTKVIVYDSVNA
jgi:hypothetical protein